MNKPPIDPDAKPSDTNNAGTMAVLELAGPWLNTNRIVVADSAFASVRTAAALID